MTRIRQDLFNARHGLDRGRGRLVECLWYACKILIFLTAWPWPSRFKARLLRCFGARVGKGVVIKPRVNILFPWKLEIGDHAWIGEEVSILNFEPVRIGRQCCVSQRVLLCAGNHDYRDERMAYRNRPIVIGDGAWLGAGAFVGPGLEVGTETVVTANSVVSRSLPAGMICSGHPCRPVKVRWPASTSPSSPPPQTASPNSPRT